MNYRTLLRNVDRTLAAIESAADVTETIARLCDAVLHNFRTELGIFGGRLYIRRDREYVLERGFGRSKSITPGLAVSADYAPIRRAEEEGIDVTDLSDPTVDRDLEFRLGVRRFAAISVGDGAYLLSFDVSPRIPVEDLTLALGILRSAVDGKVRSGKLEGLIHEARRIQQSILPRTLPSMGDFDVAAVSRPAELVGGDFYDFIPLGNDGFGAAIADASGHGLLAALLVRDVYVGLRMGIANDLKLTRTVERLNRILNKSRLTTKFVSLFYAEIETNGEVLYVNAGHNAPLLLRARGGAFEELAPTGMVLGPSADARYGRRAFRMEPGDLVCLYTDGIVEATDSRGREFGMGKLKRILSEMRRRPASETVERILLATGLYTGQPTPDDDQTVVIIRRRTPDEKKGSTAGVSSATPGPGTTPPSDGALPEGARRG